MSWPVWNFRPEFEPYLTKFVEKCLQTDAVPDEFQNKIKWKETKSYIDIIESTQSQMLLECSQTPSKIKIPILEKSDKKNSEEMEVNDNCQMDVCEIDCIDLVEKLEGNAEAVSLTEISDTKLFVALPALSDSGILNLCTLLCKTPEAHYKSSLICNYLLLPKLSSTDQEYPKLIMSSLQLMLNTFPEQIIISVLVPLLSIPSSNISTLQNILSELKPQYKQSLLRYFVMNNEKLEEWQIPLLQTFITPINDSHVYQRLLDIISGISEAYNRNVKLGNLLLSVIQQMGPHLPELLKEQLRNIVAQHKSYAIGKIHKAIHSLNL